MKKKEKNAVIKTCLDILPVRSWEPSVGAFLLADSSYLDLLRLVPRDLQNIAEDELELEIYQFTKVLKTVGCDLKFLSMRFPLSLERQKAVLLHHARQAGDETRIRWLERQIRELEVAETNISSQHFYLAYWGKDADTLRKNHDMIRKYAATGYQPLVEEIDARQKAKVLEKLAKHEHHHRYLPDGMMTPHRALWRRKDEQENGQSSGRGRTALSADPATRRDHLADPSYTRMGDGYCRCLHIYGLPNTLDRHWLTRIFTVSGCICSFDVATEDMAAVKRSINRSIGEEGARAYDAKDYNALYDAQKRQAELQQLYDELERMGEVMKICDFRIFLQAQMLAELEEKTKELQDNLDAPAIRTPSCWGNRKRNGSLFTSRSPSHTPSP